MVIDSCGNGTCLASASGSVDSCVKRADCIIAPALHFAKTYAALCKLHTFLFMLNRGLFGACV